MTTIAGDISDNVNSAIDNVIGNNLVAGENIKITETINPDTNRKTFTISAKGGNGSNIYIESDNGATVNSESGTIKITGDDKNLFTTTTDNKISVKLKDDVELNSITTGSVSVSTKGVNAGGHKVVNVAKGEINSASNDAVNGSQLYETNAQVVQNMQRIEHNKQSIERLNSKIDHVDKRAKRGTAIAGAIAMLPQPSLSGKSMLSAATTNYRGEQALAIGYSALSNNGHHIIKLSGSTNVSGKKDLLIGASYGYQW